MIRRSQAPFSPSASNLITSLVARAVTPPPTPAPRLLLLSSPSDPSQNYCHPLAPSPPTQTQGKSRLEDTSPPSYEFHLSRLASSTRATSRRVRGAARRFVGRWTASWTRLFMLRRGYYCCCCWIRGVKNILKLLEYSHVYKSLDFIYVIEELRIGKYL